MTVDVSTMLIHMGWCLGARKKKKKVEQEQEGVGTSNFSF